MLHVIATLVRPAPYLMHTKEILTFSNRLLCNVRLTEINEIYNLGLKWIAIYILRK